MAVSVRISIPIVRAYAVIVIYGWVILEIVQSCLMLSLFDPVLDVRDDLRLDSTTIFDDAGIGDLHIECGFVLDYYFIVRNTSCSLVNYLRSDN